METKHLFYINGLGERHQERSKMALIRVTESGQILAMPYSTIGGMRHVRLYSADGKFIKVQATYSGTITECRTFVHMLAESSLL
jgi:hypothetical protein